MGNKELNKALGIEEEEGEPVKEEETEEDIEDGEEVEVGDDEEDKKEVPKAEKPVEI